MVLGEFTQEDKEKIFSNLKLRKYLITSIKKQLTEDLDELPELNSDDILINLALEYLLENLEAEKEDNANLILGIEQVYLMANHEFIKDNILS